MSRIVVLTNGNFYARLILDRLISERGSDIAGIILVNGDYVGRSGARGFWPIARATAFPYLFAKILQMIAFRVAEKVWRGSRLSVRSFASAHGIELMNAVSIKEQSVSLALRRWSPDLLVSVSCPQKIPSGMFKSCRWGGINIHSSLLPAIAGLAPYYWALVLGLRSTGTTVHYLTPKFDNGNILARATVPILPGDSAFSLFERLAVAGSGALLEAVNKAETGDPGEKQETSGRSYYSHPSVASWRTLRKNGFVILRISDLLSAIRSQVPVAGRAAASKPTN